MRIRIQIRIKLNLIPVPKSKKSKQDQFPTWFPSNLLQKWGKSQKIKNKKQLFTFASSSVSFLSVPIFFLLFTFWIRIQEVSHKNPDPKTLIYCDGN